MTAVAVVYCFASPTPALASQNGEITHPSLLKTTCCQTAQTQVVQLPELGSPIAGTTFDNHETSRTGAAHVLSPSWRASVGDIQQAPSFTTDRPASRPGGRWMSGQARPGTGLPGRFVAGLTAGDAQVLAYVGSGETENWLVQAPVANQLPEVSDCAHKICAGNPLGNGDFAVSGSFGFSARAVGTIDGGSAMAQASQPGSNQVDGTQAPADSTKQVTVDPTAPADGSTPPGQEFSGSSEPAGPDLTESEEQSAISQGWK